MASSVAIINPKAGRGSVRTHFPVSVEVLHTQAPRHATELTRTAIQQGATTIIAVGGDGTINEVVNGFFEDENPIGRHTILSIVPHGTGSDFYKVLQRQRSGEERMVDLIKVRYTADDGSRRNRYAINVVSMGMGGVVAMRMSRTSKALGSFAAFLTASLRTATTFSAPSVALQFDDDPPIDATIMNLAIGNGQFHGAGMWICPAASIDDGLLDVTVVHYLTLPELVMNLPLLYRGGIYSHPKVRSRRVTHFAAESRERVLIEIDGEPAGRLPMEVAVVPKAIRLLMP